MIELLCTDYNKKATFIHYNLNSAVLASISDDKYRHKVEMVNLVLSGLTPSYLSTDCSSSKRMITLWVKIADEQGFEALKPKKPTGRPAKLTEKQMKEIQRVLEEDDPKKYGQNVWDGSSLSAYIEDTYTIKPRVRQCQRLFHTPGFSLVRPQTFPSKGEHNGAERTEYKKLKNLQNDDSAVVIYQDEVHFQITTSVTRKWVFKGSKPKVKSAPGRKSVPYSGYVIPRTGELIVTKPSWFTYETVIDSFRQLLKNYPVADKKRIYLILDNAPWHKKSGSSCSSRGFTGMSGYSRQDVFHFPPTLFS